MDVFFFSFLRCSKPSYAENHAAKPVDVLLDRSPILISKSFSFKYIGMNKITRDKHHQITLYIKQDQYDTTFILFLRLLRGIWPPYLSSPLQKVTRPSLRDLGRKWIRAFPSGPSLANGLWPALGQTRAEHGEDVLKQGLSSTTLNIFESSLFEVGMEHNSAAPQYLELNDLCLWVMLALWMAAAGDGGTQNNAKNQSVERLCQWSSMLNVGARIYWQNLFHLGQGR